ncbi:hypothetical protein Mapa_006183 [Marchantia paleacea]|nr:hypothetical protein Mapa_006183 [Marchantia paleacea]
MATPVRNLTVAVLVVSMLMMLLQCSVAQIFVENRSQNKNISVHDLTQNLIIDPLAVGRRGRFDNISSDNQNLFKIVNLKTLEIITKQFFVASTNVSIVDDEFGGLSLIHESGSCAQ